MVSPPRSQEKRWLTLPHFPLQGVAEDWLIQIQRDFAIFSKIWIRTGVMNLLLEELFEYGWTITAWHSHQGSIPHLLHAF